MPPDATPIALCRRDTPIPARRRPPSVEGKGEAEPERVHLVKIAARLVGGELDFARLVRRLSEGCVTRPSAFHLWRFAAHSRVCHCPEERSSCGDSWSL